MSNLSNSQIFESKGGAFVDDPQKSVRFIPTSMSKDEGPTHVDRQDSLSTSQIGRMVQELEEPIDIEIRESESTVSTQGSFIHPRAALDVEVEEMG
uniref:Uncharacterized protein n=1 Tax=Cannabis sativa TaxID=3483 RepID=A0A803PB04_CANSA